MNKGKHIIFIGTSSNAGKTFLTGFIGKILNEKLNINVAPFKAQNMSNYASVCEGNKEISIAQSFQAKLMNTIPLADMNPILLKPIGNGYSQMVIRGEYSKNIFAKTYYDDIEILKPIVDASFLHIEDIASNILIEGAGSGFELNLQNRDLANYYMMNKHNVDIILVANIENGGVFPSILGCINLLEDHNRDKLKGVIINNFRGDISLFEDGVKIIENWGIPVLGVIPHFNYDLDAEDSLGILNAFSKKNDNPVNIAVIRYPKASNINDVEPLIHDPNSLVSFVTSLTNLNIFDKIVLPGSKSVMDDLQWLKNTGLFAELKETKSDIYGICGGYQMLHKEIYDPYNLESSYKRGNTTCGLGLIDANIEFQHEKIVKRKNYKLFDDFIVEGFEMHKGISDTYPIYYSSKKVKGAMVHEVFNDDKFRAWWLSENLSEDAQEWNFSLWKNNLQNTISDKLFNIIDWERLLR